MSCSHHCTMCCYNPGTGCKALKKTVRLPIAVLPDKRKDCCCTPETCICKKPPVDNAPGSGKVGE